MQLGRKLAEGYAVDISDEPVVADVTPQPDAVRVEAGIGAVTEPATTPTATPAQV